jgi:large repetitive protein
VRVSNNSPAEAFNFAIDDLAVAPYAASLSLSPTTLSAATVAAAYNQTITASGGTSPYTYAVTAGALPAGMTLSSAGALSGTPTAGGSFTFTITATDSTGGTPMTGSQAYTLTVNAPTISVSPTSLPDETLNVAYSQAITASGGTAPYTYAITAGALPTGLSLSSGGSLSGTPGASGTFNFTVTATDSPIPAPEPMRSRSLTLRRPRLARQALLPPPAQRWVAPYPAMAPAPR